MVPQISIQTQRGLIGVESEPGHYDIRRPQPVLHIETTPAVITANNRPGDLQIDQTLTNDALNGGKPEAFWKRVYSQYREIAMQNLQKIVEEGNRIGDLRVKGNPMAEMALDEFVEGAPDLEVFGPASPANISFSYTPNDVNIQVETGGVSIDAQTFRPEIQYIRGSVKIFMQQYPKVTITPPVINLTV